MVCQLIINIKKPMYIQIYLLLEYTKLTYNLTCLE